MSTFLSKIASKLLKTHGNNMSDVLLVLPNRRLNLFLQNELAKSTNSAILLPRTITLKSLVQELSELVVPDQLSQIFELYKVYKAQCIKLDQEPQSIDRFLGWGRMLLADINEVDSQLANGENFFNILQHFKSLSTWQPGESDIEAGNQTVENYLAFWQLLEAIYKNYNAALSKKGYAYDGMVYRYAAENIEKLHAKIEEEQIYFVGFSAFNASEKQIVKYLTQNRNCELLWDLDEYYLKDNSQEAGKFYRQYIKEFHVDNVTWSGKNIASNPKNVTSIGAAGNIGQALAVREILQNHLKIDNETANETAIILADENMLLPLRHNLPGNITNVNITMGLPFKSSQLYSLFELLFNMQQNRARLQEERKSSLGYYHQDLQKVLNHAYVVSFTKKSSDLQSKIASENLVFVPQSPIDSLKDKALNTFIWHAETPADLTEKSFELANFLIAIFEEKVNEGQAEAKIDLEYLYKLRATLNRLNEIIQEDAGLDVSAYRQLLLDELKAINMPFEGEPLKGLQIMGMLESRGLDFKNVIILNLNEGIYPSGKSSNSFIPFEMRKAFGLNTYADKDSIFAYLFYRLFHQAENVYMLYNTERNDLGDSEKSRFIAQVELELAANNSNINYQSRLLNLKHKDEPVSNEIIIEKSAAIMDKIAFQLTNEKRGLSASGLNTYNRCSLKYYFQYIAKFREDDEVEETLAANTFGTLVHEALDIIYKELSSKNKFIDAVRLERFLKRKENIVEAIDLAVKDTDNINLNQLNDGKNKLLYEVSKLLVESLIKFDVGRIKALEKDGKQLKIESLEDSMAYHLEVNGLKVRVNGKADRIDEIDGEIQIIDYKTGKTENANVEVPSIDELSNNPNKEKALQLMFYALLYSRKYNNGKPIKSGIYTFRKMSKGIINFGIKEARSKAKADNNITQALVNNFEEFVVNSVTELTDSSIPFKQTNEVDDCAYCPYLGICQR